MSRAQRILSEWAIVVIALLTAPGAYALGLGEARVESFLNQKLDVRMRLLDASPEVLDSLTVSPASPEDFERLGLMSNSLGLELEVTIDRSESPAVVRVTSRRPVTDPVVQLLIDARWANGRMLREYTVFLDPATSEVEAPPAASAPSEPDDDAAAAPVAEAPSERRDAPPASGPERTATPAEPRAAVAGPGRYGPVASGETLWSIAGDNLPAGDVTMDQMMIAIVELNPDAFREENINRLLRGAELELPDAGRARQVDAAAARAAVAAQNRAFRRSMEAEVPRVSSAGRQGVTDGGVTDDGEAEDAIGGDVSDASGPAGDSDDAAEDHRLSLVPPGDEESGTGASDDGAEVESLRQRLARAEEELLAARQETEEFRSRVEELETLVRGDDPGGVGIRDAELAGLEETLRQARRAAREDADPELRAEVSERLDKYLAELSADSTDPDAAEQADEALAAAPDDETSEPTPGDESPASDEQAEAGTETGTGETPSVAEAESESERAVTRVGGESGGLLSNPLVLGVIGLLVLAGLAAGGWFALRARREPSGEEPAVRGAATPGPRRPAPESPVDAARVRVDRTPRDLSAHLALLQTLATDGNESAFGDALESMFEHVESGQEPEWREALEVAGRVVPGHALVKGSSDWVADVGDQRREPASEVDEESDVDDLMARLDADMDEADDSDWVGEETGDETSEPEGPLLRDDYDADSHGASDRAVENRDESVGPGDDDEFVDLGALGEPADEAGSGSSEGEPAGETGESGDDDLLLDWPDAEDKAGEGHAERGGAPAGSETASDDSEPLPAGDEDESEDDIFAPSDDDVAVKLDLAKAYLSWNSTDSARTLLEEIAREGNDAQREEAAKLLNELSDDSDR